MPLNEQVLLDIRSALAAIDQLETRLQTLTRPIDIAVDVDIPPAAQRLATDIQRADDAVDDLNRELGQTERELDDVGDQSKRTGQELERAGKQGQSAFRGLAGALTAVGAGVLAARGIRELAGFLGDSVMAASDLEQAVGGVESIFGEASTEIFAFGQTAADSVGLAESAFLSLSSQLGAQLQAFGFNAAEAATQTNNLIQLSADLAATFGGPVSDAVGAVASLLRGEFNPIERFGVAMNVASIQAHALAVGIIDTNRQMTIQERALGALDLLYQQTTGAQGQFARESDTVAGQLERLTAAFTDAQSEIGQALVPAVSALIDVLPALVEGIAALAPAIAGAIGPLGVLALEFAGLTGAIPKAEADLRKWSLQAGISMSSADLLAGAFVQLQRGIDLEGRGAFQNATDQLDEFRQGVQDFLAVAETSPTELRRLFTDIGNLDEFLTPDQIRIVREELLQLLATTGQFSSFSEADRFVGGLVTALDDIPPAAESAASSLDFIEGLDITERVDEWAEAFQRLPDEMDAAAAALRDEQGEIITDFSDFLDDLASEAESRVAFAENIGILRAAGLDNLAATFEREGLEASEALADAVANPQEAARAEALLEETAARLAEAYGSQFTGDVQAWFADNPLTIPATIIPQFGGFGNIPGVGGFTNPNLPSSGNLGGGGAQPLGPGGGAVIVENNFYTAPQPDTDTTRISQAMANLYV